MGWIHFANVFLLGINGTTFYTKCQVKTTRYYQKKSAEFSLQSENSALIFGFKV